MRLVASGLYSHEIAARLGLAEATVKAHIRSVLEKTDARCRTEAVMTGLAEGWIPCPRTCPYHPSRTGAHIVRWGGTA